MLNIENTFYELGCLVRRAGNSETEYVPCENEQISFYAEKATDNGISSTYRITVKNDAKTDFTGVVNIVASLECKAPKFFMPGYMYNRNTADMPSSGRKAFPRIKSNPGGKPESDFFMTRSDRLAEPVSIIYDKGHILGISAPPVIKDNESGNLKQFCGFTCKISDGAKSSVGYTLGYENAPWLFVQTATVLEREPVTEANSFFLAYGAEYSFEIKIYSYEAQNEMGVHEAIKDVYRDYHESPRKIPGMDENKALSMLSSAIRDYAWLEKEGIYTGFVYDRPDGLAYNRIPSLSWTNGLSIAVPMLMAADKLGDEKAREQSLSFINDTLQNSLNINSGFLYESVDNGTPTVRGWWYNGMHSGGHSSYINGQAVYYILKAYKTEKEVKNIVHKDWLDFAGMIVSKMQKTINADYEYPFSMSEKTGTGLEYDSMGGAWFLAASAMYELLSGDKTYLLTLLKSETHYYETFVKKVECYGGPLDTDKAVDSEGVLSYIRAARILHEITGADYLLDHLRDALYYEFTFKLCYNTKVQVRPLSEIGWSSCGGSITSTANPHIHPMSNTVCDEMKYYLKCRDDDYVRSRLEDTIGWGLQTFNTVDREYGYGKPGWMSERFCFCQGLLTEHYPDGEVASTWFALMPWASASIIEGLV